MNTPKTAALWELLREMGWSEDQRPVSFIMQSHEELEKELRDLEAGFDADGRTAAEACCEEFKQDQAARIKALERDLDQARQDAKQSELDAIRALGERNDAREELTEVSKDYRCLAELLDGHDATECRANLVRLKESLAAETARADEQFALAMELAAKLETERVLADRLAHEVSCLANWREAYGANCHYDHKPLREWIAARIDQTLDECVAKSAESRKPLPGDPEQLYPQEKP